MVGTGDRRTVVTYLVQNHQVSITTSCRTSGFSKSQYYYQSKKDDSEVVDKLNALVENKPNRGFPYFFHRPKGWERPAAHVSLPIGECPSNLGLAPQRKADRREAISYRFPNRVSLRRRGVRDGHKKSQRDRTKSKPNKPLNFVILPW